MLCSASLAPAQNSFSVAAANDYVRRQDWNGLLRYSNAWTGAKPRDEMGWFYLASTYGMGLKNHAQAVPAFQRAVSLKSNWPEAWNALGFELVALNRNDEAVNAFTNATQQAPNKANYWNSLAAAYSYSNRISKAIDALEHEQRAVGSNLTYVDWYNLANGFLTMEEFSSATNAYRQALRLNASFAPAWNNLGTLEGRNGNNNAALQDYQQAAKLGDALGARNYNRLQNAIAEARQSHSDDPMRQLQISLNKELEYRAHQAWQERLARAQN